MIIRHPIGIAVCVIIDDFIVYPVFSGRQGHRVARIVNPVGRKRPAGIELIGGYNGDTVRAILAGIVPAVAVYAVDPALGFGKRITEPAAKTPGLLFQMPFEAVRAAYAEEQFGFDRVAVPMDVGAVPVVDLVLQVFIVGFNRELVSVPEQVPVITD